MKRRGFLTGLTGILAAAAAPAIIHNAMKIHVPKQFGPEKDYFNIWTGQASPQTGRGLTSPIFHLDEAPYQRDFAEAIMKNNQMFGKLWVPQSAGKIFA